MAVNIFEELVKTYLQTLGYFTIENVPYALAPSANSIEGPSDIDILALRPAKKDRKVLAVSCKGYPKGIDLDAAQTAIINGGKIHNREAQKSFRELANDQWAGAFRDAIFKRTGTKEFVYVTALVKFQGDKSSWCNNPAFTKRMGANQLDLLTLEDIWATLTNPATRLPHHNHMIGEITGLFKST
jgi:hypothetical protein